MGIAPWGLRSTRSNLPLQFNSTKMKRKVSKHPFFGERPEIEPFPVYFKQIPFSSHFLLDITKSKNFNLFYRRIAQKKCQGDLWTRHFFSFRLCLEFLRVANSLRACFFRWDYLAAFATIAKHRTFFALWENLTQLAPKERLPNRKKEVSMSLQKAWGKYLGLCLESVISWPIRFKAARDVYA